MYEPPFTLSNELSARCIELAELVGRVAAPSDLSTSPTLHRRLRIETIYSSLAIEQNSLTPDQVTAVLDGKHVLGNGDDILEVQNADRAYVLLDDLDPLSITDLLRVHGAMMQGLRPDAGTFRSGDVGVFDGPQLIHAGTPARYVPSVVADLFEWLSRTDLHPLLAACVFHYELEFIHPFSDGNGRTGRLWHTLILSRWRPVLAWLPVESVIFARQAEYYVRLNEANACGDSAPFVSFMVDVMREAILPYCQHGGTDPDEEALTYLRRHPDALVADLAHALGISKRSAERLVRKLKETGRLERVGSARAGRWEALSGDDARQNGFTG